MEKVKGTVIFLFLVFLLFCGEHPGMAQRRKQKKEQASIDGYVSAYLRSYDQYHEGVSRATVYLIQGEKIDSTTTTYAGNFSFKKLSPGEVTLKVFVSDALTYYARNGLTFEDFEGTFNLLPGKNVVLIDMKTVTYPHMRAYFERYGHEGEVEIDTLIMASVTARRPAMIQRGDTLIFDPSVFQDNIVSRMLGNYAIGTLEKLPGVRISDEGQLTVMGNQVHHTYVNGALIFGVDPLAPFKNISDDEFLSLEVYDENGKYKVANMKTRNPIFSVTDIQALAATGMDEDRGVDGKLSTRYSAGMKGNLYSELLAVSGHASVGNTQAGELSTSYKPLTSDSRDILAGFSFEKYRMDRLKGDAIVLNYSYADSDQRSTSHSLAEYFSLGSDPGRTIADTLSSSSRSRSHSLQSNLKWQTFPLGPLSFLTTVQFANSDNLKTDMSSTIIPGIPKAFRSESVLKDGYSWNIGEQMTFNPIMREFGMVVSFSGQWKKGYDTGSAMDTLRTSYSRRHFQGDGYSEGKRLSASVRSNLLPRSLNSALPAWAPVPSFSYTLTYNSTRQKQLSYDLLDPSHVVQNAANTYDYTYEYLSQEYSISFSESLEQVFGRKLGSFSFNFRLNLDDVLGYDNHLVKITESDRRFVTFNPQISYGIVSKNKSNLNLSYRTGSRLPSSEQLKRRVDDTNPMMLQAGNPELVLPRTHSVALTGNAGSLFDISGAKNSDYQIRGELTADYTSSPIIAGTEYFPVSTWLEQYRYQMPAGSILRTYTNADYELSARASADISAKLDLVKNFSTIRLSPSLTYNNRPQMTGTLTGRVSDLTPAVSSTVSLDLVSKIKTSATAGVSYSRQWTKSGSFSNEVLSGRMGVSLKTIPMKNSFLDADYNWLPLRVLSGAGVSNGRHELNVSGGVDIPKFNITVSVSGVNLLGNRSVYSTQRSENRFMQSWKPSFGRYFMLSLFFRFNSTLHQGVDLPSAQSLSVYENGL